MPNSFRNAPCPCGATKADGKPVKYKNCCMKTFLAQQDSARLARKEKRDYIPILDDPKPEGDAKEMSDEEKKVRTHEIYRRAADVVHSRIVGKEPLPARFRGKFQEADALNRNGGYRKVMEENVEKLKESVDEPAS